MLLGLDQRKGLEMENSGVLLFIGGIVVTVFLVMGGMFNLRRHDMAAMKSIDEMTATGTKVWSYLTPAQQDELKSIESLLIQEEWIEENVEPSVLNGVSPERILIEFANRGFIILGQGVFRRHSSPLDFIEPKAQILEPLEVFTDDEEIGSEEDQVEEDVEKEELILVVSGNKCPTCNQLLPEQPLEEQEHIVENPKSKE